MTTTTTTIKATTIKGFEKLLKDGANKDKLEGFLLFEEVPKKDAITFLKEKGVIGKVTFRKWLTNVCADRVLLLGEFEEEITKQSDNVKRHYSVYNNERLAYNTIHAKYDTEAKSAIEADKDTESTIISAQVKKNVEGEE